MSGVILVVASALAYGTVPVLARLAFRTGIGLPSFLAWRFSLAAALLWAAVPLTGGRVPDRRRVAGLIAMGALGYAGQSAAFFLALARMPAASTALLLYTYPAFVTLGSVVCFRERLTRRSLAAILVAFAGTTLIVWGQAGGFSPLGVAFALLSAVIYSGYILFGSRLFAGPAPVAAAAVVMSATAAAYLAAATALHALALPSAGGQIGFVALIAVAGTAVPVLAFLAGMPRVGPSRASIISTIEPAVTVVLAGIVLAEPLGATQLVGALCILGSVAVLEAGRRPEPARI